ncbi:MAG: hypothetical protein ACKPE3_35165, partial [Sphaerospermopsis kisseleviana]
LFNGFKKDTDPNIDFVDLLPYADEIKEDNRKVSQLTEAIISDLIKTNNLPVPVLSALSLLL